MSYLGVQPTLKSGGFPIRIQGFQIILKVTYNTSHSVQPQVFKIEHSIWVCSIWFTDARLKFECDNLRGT